jgi:hypothetical protein
LRFLSFVHQRPDLSEYIDFLTNPRLDDPGYLTTLAILLASVFVLMSWFSRAAGGGSWSPFGRSSNRSGASEVTDDNYSYITKEDLAREEQERGSGGRDGTDVLVFKHGRTHFPTHFPGGCIADGTLRVGDVRGAAARELGVTDKRRVRLFFKGRNLKDDERRAWDCGLRGEGSGSEILCVVGEAGSGSMAPGSEDTGRAAWSEGEDEEDDSEDGAAPGEHGAKTKKKRRRGKKSKKKKSGTADGASPGLAYSNTANVPAEFLPTPSSFSTPRPTPSPSQAPPSRTQTPQTPLAKLDALASKFHTELVPMCVTFMQNPPQEKAKREFEYKKLSETILTGARARRKELVREVQGMLNQLDKVVHE